MLSHWLTEAGLSTEETAPALEGEDRADICIVGGGFCGLWTAIRLKERDPSIDIAIVEKDECGSGASGRNGGFVLSWWAKFGSLCKFCPSDEAVRLVRASADAVGEIGRFCADQGIDAHYRGDGWLWAASSEPQVGSWSALVDTLERHQLHPFELWEPETVKRRSGTDRHIAGVYEPTGASVQPALLARGLRRVALSKGVRIYERTPLTRLDRSRPPRVVTPRGTLTADKVVIAMNAWATMFPELRRTIVVISSDIVATRPMPERLAASGWSDGMCISDSRTLVNYYRPTVDGRVAFGTGGGRLSFGNRADDRFNGASPRAREVEGYFRRIYPNFSDVPIATSWTGPIDRSLSGLPFFGRLGGRDDLLYGLGFSGNGVGPTSVGGRILASLALGDEGRVVRVRVGTGGSGALPARAGALCRRAHGDRGEPAQGAAGGPGPARPAPSRSSSRVSRPPASCRSRESTRRRRRPEAEACSKGRPRSLGRFPPTTAFRSAQPYGPRRRAARGERWCCYRAGPSSSRSTARPWATSGPVASPFTHWTGGARAAPAGC